MLRPYRKGSVSSMTFGFYFSIVGLILLQSCQNHKPDDCTGHFVEIAYKTGDHFYGWGQKSSDVEVFLPLPVYLSDKKKGIATAIIGQNMGASQRICTVPIACMDYKEGNELIHLIVAIPADHDHRIIDVSDLSDLMIRHESIRYLIQEWFLRYRGLGKNNLVRWKSADYAQTLLN